MSKKVNGGGGLPLAPASSGAERPTVSSATPSRSMDSNHLRSGRGSFQVWQIRKLGEIAEFINGRAYKAEEFKESGTPIVRIQNLTGIGNTVYSDLELPPNKYIEYGDLIYAWSATFGPYIWKGPKSIFHYHIWKILCKEVDKHFLYYHLLNVSDSLKDSGNGTLFIHITKELMESFEIHLPPINEQTAIAEILSKMDEKIDLLHRQNKTIKSTADSLFKQWFVEEAKEDWEPVRVGDFVQTNIASIDRGYKRTSIKYLDTGSLTEGHIESYQYLNLKSAPSRARRLVKHNDILISTVRPDQRHYGILKNPDDETVVSTGFCVVTCEKIDPHFIYMFLTTDEMTEYLHSIAEGSTSTYPSLKPSDIENLEFALPPKKKLDAFSAYAENAWKKIDSNHQSIRTLNSLRETLLPKLMSGEIRVSYES